MVVMSGDAYVLRQDDDNNTAEINQILDVVEMIVMNQHTVNLVSDGP